jgi:hypothetical protein
MIAALALAAVVAGGVTSRVPPADRLRVSGTVTAGTGLSLAGAGGHTLSARSPIFLQIEAGFTHPSLPWIEFSPAILLELENRVGVGVNPKVRAFLPLRGPRIYGIVGLPVFIAPYSLLGVQGGMGLAVHVHDHLALVAEVTAAAYFWGSDLMRGGALGKLDVACGLRVVF